ncbi:hypothetical protein H2198_004442 [Neophaeococcomyces mojaviensis]|uniref:Uncharacterized protein n=1 Tax=Neophaeococcomyces mojaviensis TaxID=3383035 RepID=A0ACC3A8S8_9EURO|nr:hypothetical protein H2198_004442 [Knufia sp. JES_112]
MAQSPCTEREDVLLNTANLARESASSSDQSSLARRARDWTLDTISGLSSNLRGLDRSRTPSCSSFESCSTEATSVTSEDDYTRVGNHLVVCSSATTSYYKFTQDQVYLQKDVEGQLCDVLKKDHVYFVWLRLVGRTAHNIRPAIVLATSEVRTKRAITKFLRKASFMPRLRDCRLDMHVILSSSGAACNLDGEKPPETSPTSSPEILMHITQHSLGNTLTVRSHHDQEQRSCIAGGIVIADGQLLTLAPNHTHKAFVDKRSLWRAATTPISLDEISYQDKMPFSIWSDENDDNESWQTSPQDTEYTSGYVHQFSLDSSADDSDSSEISFSSSSTDIRSSLTMAAKSAGLANPFSTSRPSTPSSHNASSTQDHGFEMTHRLEGKETTSVSLTVQSQSEAADWMALKLDSDSDGSKSFIPTVNEVNGYVIDEVFDWSSERSVPVTLAMPNGEITGHLQVGSVLYRVGETLYDLRCVTLDQPLKRGCSGTWVTHNNQLCGVIIAINDNKPEVFILPFHYVIKDIERVLQCRVQLPTTNLEPPTCAASGVKPNLRDTGSIGSVGEHSTLPFEPFSVSGYTEVSEKEQADLSGSEYIPCRPPSLSVSKLAKRLRKLARPTKLLTQLRLPKQLEDAIHKRTIADEETAGQSLLANNLATPLRPPEDGEPSREVLYDGYAQADPRLVAEIENPDAQSSAQHELPSFDETWPNTDPRAHARRYSTYRSSFTSQHIVPNHQLEHKHDNSLSTASVASSILGVATAGLRLSCMLNAISRDIGREPEEVRALSTSITLFCLMLKQTAPMIYQDDFFCSQKAQIVRQAHFEGETVFTEIGTMLDRFRRIKESHLPSPPTQYHFEVVLPQVKTKYLIERLDKLQMSLTMMLQIDLFRKPLAGDIGVAQKSHTASQQSGRSDKKFLCEICSGKKKQFSTSNDLAQHQKTVHGKMQVGDCVWICKIADCPAGTKSWPRLDNFKQHLIKMHGNINLNGPSARLDPAYCPEKSNSLLLNFKPQKRQHFTSFGGQSSSRKDFQNGPACDDCVAVDTEGYIRRWLETTSDADAFDRSPLYQTSSLPATPASLEAPFSNSRLLRAPTPQANTVKTRADAVTCAQQYSTSSPPPTLGEAKQYLNGSKFCRPDHTDDIWQQQNQQFDDKSATIQPTMPADVVSQLKNRCIPPLFMHGDGIPQDELMQNVENRSSTGPIKFLAEIIADRLSPLSPPRPRRPTIGTISEVSNLSSKSDGPSYAGPKTEILRQWPQDVQDPLANYQIFKMKDQLNRSFLPGKVFATIWHENHGQRLPDRRKKLSTKPTGTEGFATEVTNDMRVYSHIRRFVVITQCHGHSIAVPVNSYGNRGLSQRASPNGRMSDAEFRSYSSMFMNQKKLQYTHGEPKSTKEPICVNLPVRKEALSPASRLYYAKLQSINYNTKFKHLGYVIPEHIARFMLFNSTCANDGMEHESRHNATYRRFAWKFYQVTRGEYDEQLERNAARLAPQPSISAAGITIHSRHNGDRGVLEEVIYGEVSQKKYVELNSALVYLSHSYEPSLEIDTDLTEARVAKGRDL